MDKKKLSIAIPASVISDTPHLREKTSKIGLIGRAAAIFRVDEIIVYPDYPKVNQTRDLDFIALLLSYLETPQYLRKTLFKIEPRLQYAGILPPLRTPHHPASGKTRDLKVGEYREGLVTAQSKEGLLVDIGVEQPALMRQTQFSIGDRLTLQVINVDARVEVQPVDRLQVPAYWGYQVCVEKRSFGQLAMEGQFDFVIATARLGAKFVKAKEEIGEKWRNSQKILVAFGAPSRGLHEIAKSEGKRINDLADFVVNTIPEQGTATVRTEEALLATLAIFNACFS
jgi:predicted SPOUT superfamily RNA methylase MTH1